MDIHGKLLNHWNDVIYNDLEKFVTLLKNN